MKSKLILPAAAVLITAAVSFGLNAIAATFSEPSGAPPSNNAYAPLDSSGNTNIKAGILGMNGLTVYSSTVLAADSGNVGIGTYSPSQKLDVAGYVRASSGFCMGDDCRSSWGTPIYQCPSYIPQHYPQTGDYCQSTCNGLSTGSSCTYQTWDNQEAPACNEQVTVTCPLLGHMVQ